MPRKPSAPAGDARRRGRPPKGADDPAIRDLPTVTLRVDAELLARLDAVVARRNRELAAQGAQTSRGAVAVLALRSFVEAEEKRAAEGSP